MIMGLKVFDFVHGVGSVFHYTRLLHPADKINFLSKVTCLRALKHWKTKTKCTVLDVA
jgi:hypothetical protein